MLIPFIPQNNLMFSQYSNLIGLKITKPFLLSNSNTLITNGFFNDYPLLDDYFFTTNFTTNSFNEEFIKKFYTMDSYFYSNVA